MAEKIDNQPKFMILFRRLMEKSHITSFKARPTVITIHDNQAQKLLVNCLSLERDIILLDRHNIYPCLGKSRVHTTPGLPMQLKNFSILSTVTELRVRDTQNSTKKYQIDV